ncbi:unnamed protein product [Symbiodinium natans]|uniref:EF-hand domain-containing protein n=1 Tax=Symbiodinium natans TaxID=878477 RepID=A0A812M9G1_9DINO|nr:unnamed protein product [Symbiodinium natans]
MRQPRSLRRACLVLQTICVLLLCCYIYHPCVRILGEGFVTTRAIQTVAWRRRAAWEKADRLADLCPRCSIHRVTRAKSHALRRTCACAARANVESQRAALTIVQITDVYMLDNFPHLKNMILEKKAQNPNTISMLTGDFLAPYLLSTIDQGFGMMRMLNSVPVDFLTWGNHEADIPHATVCRHVREFQGTWLNSNMQTHEAMKYQEPFHIVTVPSPDGSHVRKIGLVALLSNEADLYKHFKAPGAFGGAKIDCPWDTLRYYKELLEVKHGCDLVLPLQHLYVHQDHRTCREFDVPVILSGHDHHQVDEVVEGTRLLKPGQDAHYATVLEIGWESPSDSAPSVTAEFARVADWPADPEMVREAERSYAVLDPLRNTELCTIPAKFRPLSSVGPRERVTTMGGFICTIIRDALNSHRDADHHVDAVLLMGGNIRGSREYMPDAFFSLEALEAEIKEDEVLGIVDMPGWLVMEGVKATRGEPKPGWFQYDDGVREDANNSVLEVAGRAVDPSRTYRVATKIVDLTNGQSPPLTAYYSDRPELLPEKEDVLLNIHHLLMVDFARVIWRRIWEMADTSRDGCLDQDDFQNIDLNNDGLIGRQEIFENIRKLGLKVDDGEMSLAECIFEILDVSRDGKVTVSDLKRFADSEDLCIIPWDEVRS